MAALEVGMRKLLLSAVVLCMGVISSEASDYKGEAHAWQGPYIGIHLGGGSSSVDWTYALALTTADHDGDGVFGGVQAGYNFRTGNLVWGVEADISAASITGGTPCPNPTFSCDSDISMLGSVRLRAGFTTSRMLIYGTGGFGFGRVDISTTSAALGTNGTERNATGWTAGGGVELMVDGGWSIKAEYLYYDLGSDTYIVDSNLAVRADTTLHTGKVGFNFRY
jgi:outer membrane immunogenic protein